MSNQLRGIGVAASIAALLGVMSSCGGAGGAPTGADSDPDASIELDSDDIGGVVTSAEGPEAGVWVVAETDDTPTHFVKIVVTDDDGRFVLPELPEAIFQLSLIHI